MDTRILQLKITIKHSSPPIWIRILVDEDITFHEFSEIIQAIFEWDGYHLYEFEIDETRIGQQDSEFGFDDVINDKKAKVKDFRLREKSRFKYVYDFGDYWEHLIVVEKILEPVDGKFYPGCIKGKRSAPLEDSGGMWGYENLLDTLEDPDNPEHETAIEWTGGGIDSHVFSLEEVNENLKPFRKKYVKKERN